MNLQEMINSGAVGVSPQQYAISTAGQTGVTPSQISFPGGAPQQQTPQNNNNNYIAPRNYNSQAIADIDRSIAALNDRQNQYNSNVEGTYNTKAGGLNTNYNIGKQNLDTQQADTTRQRDMSLRQLQNSIRGQYQSSLLGLGAQGGADSSAAGMYKFAFGKAQADNTGELQNNYQYNVGKIDQSRSQLQAQFDQQMAELGDWKRQQLFGIADKFRMARDQLNAQRASMGNAFVDQAQAQAAANAANQLAQLDYTVGAYQASAQDTLAQAAAQLQGYSQANANPNVAPTTVGANGQGTGYSPLVNVKRDENGNPI